MTGIFQKKSFRDSSLLRLYFNSCLFDKHQHLFLLKSYKSILIFGTTLIIANCSLPVRDYEFPRNSFVEKQHLCHQVTFRSTKKYMVVDRKILPMKNNQIMAPIQNIESDLKEGVYLCGIFQSRNYSCSPSKIIRLDGNKCSYQ